MGKYVITDVEEGEVKAFKRWFESPLTKEKLESYYKDIDRIFRDEENKRIKKDYYNKFKLIQQLLKKKGFFTERQYQVISLLFGWNGKVFIGTRGFSDIAKIIGIKQPVVYNHFLAAGRKIVKYLKNKK